MNIRFSTFYASPCDVEVFEINNIKADLEDFGEKNLDSLGNYTCSLRGFTPFLPTDEVLEKYKISLRDYREVIEVLNEGFNYGRCAWCS